MPRLLVVAACLAGPTLGATQGPVPGGGPHRGGDHPVGVLAGMSVPPELPLVDGRLTCMTCHDPGRTAYPAFLRLAPERLCQACHPR